MCYQFYIVLPCFDVLSAKHLQNILKQLPHFFIVYDILNGKYFCNKFLRLLEFAIFVVSFINCIISVNK